MNIDKLAWRTNISAIDTYFLSLIILALSIVLIVYAQGIFFFLIDDDFQIVGAAEKYGIDAVYLSQNGLFFRPLEGFIAYLDYSLGVVGIAPIAKILQMAILIAKMLLSFVIAEQLGLRKRHAFLIAAFVGVHPINVSTVAQSDTVSQGLSDLCILFSTWWFRIVALEGASTRPRAGLSFILIIAFSLMTKESALIPVSAVIALYIYEHFKQFRLRDLVFAGLSIILIVALYAAIRYMIADLSSEIPERYRLSFGMNVLKNVCIASAGLGYLGDSSALAVRSPQGFIESFIYLGLIVTLVILRPCLKWTKIGWRLIAIGLLTLVPVIFSQGISEHNVTGALPFFALTAGLIFRDFDLPKAAVVGIALLCIIASSEKMMKINLSQEQSRRIYQAIASAPIDTDVIHTTLCFHKFTGPEYSIYRHRPARSLEWIIGYFRVYRGMIVLPEVTHSEACM